MDLTLRNLAVPGGLLDAASHTGAGVREVALDLIDPFPGHPFLVLDDADMDELAMSIQRSGIREPVLLRPAGDGRFQLVSGHRRVHAASRLGLAGVPAVVVDMDDDEATVLMVDMNLHRSRLRISEQARAFAMRHKALLHQGRAGGSTRSALARESGRGEASVARLVRVAQLSDGLLSMVDEGRIPLRAALALCSLDETARDAVERVMTARPRAHISQRAAETLVSSDGSVDETVVEGTLDGAWQSRGMPATMRIPIAWIPDGLDGTDALEWVKRACDMLREQADGQGNGGL